jgi:proton-dependent oligopeptide transporter, POT family
MFKGHPKGLFVLALANMGERFGYYTMLAIFALYLQAKFGFTPTTTSLIYATFLAFVYFLPLLGGIIADRFLGYGKTVLLGIFVMFCGYLLLALPSGASDVTVFDSAGFYMMIAALAMIALGTGFFKGNLQAMVGNIYDDVKYSGRRDVAFSIFYMFINIGAFFAPNAAEAVSNYILAQDNLKYEAKVPDLGLRYLNYKVMDSVQFRNTVLIAAKNLNIEVKNEEKYIKKEKKAQSLIYPAEKERIGGQLAAVGQEQLGNNYTSVQDFAITYKTSLGKSYKWGFAVACFSLVISVLIFLIFRNTHRHADMNERQKAKDSKLKSEIVTLTPQQTRERLIALGLVFFVVIFFWMSFHQNGLCMTFFARDYTNLNVGPGLYLWFTLKVLLPFIIGFYGLVMLVQNKDLKNRILGGFLALAGTAIITYVYTHASGSSRITPPIFQQFNPFFIVILTPIFVTVFAYLNGKGREPSAPRKIGYGMLIAALGFVILIVASMGQVSPADIEGVSDNLVSPYWLISTYFILTVAELFLSPMGISFVSRVAPPKYKGLMQGGWFAATAIGNYLVGVMGTFWDKLPLYAFWTVLVICCLLSAAFIFTVMKRLERTTQMA